jgi:tRNA threonylcarbamoyladenosine biosynthesis protein TsaB
MFNLLSFDMSMGACSVALMQGERLLSTFELAARQQSRHVLSMMKHLLAEAGLSFSQLDGVAFGCGPGSFTGVRLSASVAQAIAFSGDLPVFPVSTMQALAQGMYADFGAELTYVVFNAYAGDIYLGIYQKMEQPIVQLASPERRCLPSDFPEIPLLRDPLSIACKGENARSLFTEEPTFPSSYIKGGGKVCAAVGDGWDVYADILKDKLPASVQMHRDYFPHAKEIARIAKIDGDLGRFVAPQDALPAYLHKEDMWKKLA